MKNQLTWLHISDIHFNRTTSWRDSTSISSLIEHLRTVFQQDPTLRPDLIICTGDLAYGEISASPLVDQYKEAEAFFNCLLEACGEPNRPLPTERLFVVPGNHDVNRSKINSDSQKSLEDKAKESPKHSEKINQQFDDKTIEFRDNFRRLEEYATFVSSYLPHQSDEESRHRYARVVNIDGLKVGVAGFNSAWSCAGPDDDRKIWLAARWQFNRASDELQDSHIRIGFMHHPVDWLNETERDLATRRISTDFNFWLHGHSHNAWVDPGQNSIKIAAGAVGAASSDEFGVNIVKLDLENCEGHVHLYNKRAGEKDWVVAPVGGHAPTGVWKLNQIPLSTCKESSKRKPDREPSEYPGSELQKSQNEIPSTPLFDAQPPYIGSHQFLGRKVQLDVLDEWASPIDSHPVFLYEAIGGTGKSILTWNWVNENARAIRDDWAGILWYSFYERGAIMADFLSHALAFMTGQPIKNFKNKKTRQLGELLIQQLRQRPWLLILDGLERVLVTYHRYDAAQLPDEEAGQSDEIANRNPCVSIHPEDDEVLRSLAGSTPSKILITSRLVPKVFLNPASQPIPGILRERLSGLTREDAETLFRSCEVHGDSVRIQTFLKTHCDNHPLVIGALAGLVRNYLPDPGNFDLWVDDEEGGRQLNLGEIDLIKKRSHILEFAVKALKTENRKLLSTLSLFSESVDYETIRAVYESLPIEKRDSSSTLTEIIRDLEQRGLLQYDNQKRHYDLHPVVRGVVAGRLDPEETAELGQPLDDFFSSKSHDPYENASSLEDLKDALMVARIRLRMGRFREFAKLLSAGFSDALRFNLEAYSEVVTLLQPIFQNNWEKYPDDLDPDDASYLLNEAGNALNLLGETELARKIYIKALEIDLENHQWYNICVSLLNLVELESGSLNLAKSIRFINYALQISMPGDLERVNFYVYEKLSDIHTSMGNFQEADLYINKMNEFNLNRFPFESVDRLPFEYIKLKLSFYKNKIDEGQFNIYINNFNSTNYRVLVRYTYFRKGLWYYDQKKYDNAKGCFEESVRMAREVGLFEEMPETYLLLCKAHLGESTDTEQSIQKLCEEKKKHLVGLAELWYLVGDRPRALKYASLAYKRAWGDGEPYVDRYWLNKATALFETLGEPVPVLPPYDPAKVELEPWEEKVIAAIEEMKREKSGEGDHDLTLN